MVLTNIMADKTVYNLSMFYSAWEQHVTRHNGDMMVI